MIYTDVNIQNELYKYHYVFGYDTSNSYTIIVDGTVNKKIRLFSK